MQLLDDLYRQHRKKLVRVAGAYIDSVRAEDAVQEAFALTLHRVQTGRVDAGLPLYRYVLSVVRWCARALCFDLPIEYIERDHNHGGTEKSIINRVMAARVWSAMTTQERVAVAALHLLDEQVTRADEGIFSRRIRLAGQRLRSLAL